MYGPQYRRKLLQHHVQRLSSNTQERLDESDKLIRRSVDKRCENYKSTDPTKVTAGYPFYNFEYDGQDETGPRPT